MLDFAIFAVTFVSVLIALVIYLYPGSSKTTTIPGLDPSDPKDGNLPDMGKAGSLHEFLLDLHEQFGDIASFWMGQQLVVSIASPELFKQHGAVFDRPPLLFKLFEPLITPNSIQYANGADGRKRRNIYDRSFSHEAVSLQCDVFHKVTDELCKKLATLSKDEHVPLWEYMFALAIKAITITSMGPVFNSMKEVLSFRRDYDICWGEMESHLAGDVPEPDSPRQKRFEQSKENIFAVIRKAIAERRKNPPAEGEELLIDQVIRSAGSEEEREADVLTFTVGGFHTSGLLLTWGIYFLATHDDVQEKVYQELQDVLGNQNVTADIMPQLVYMKQVLDETLRCSVLAPYAARYQDVDTELGGHRVPSGTPVIHALGVVLQDPRLWPLPNNFDPDRFSEENRKKQKNHAFEPFGFAGKRKCPGYRFAYFEATVVLSVLLRKFHFKMVEGQVVTPVYGLVTSPADEIWVTVEPRK